MASIKLDRISKTYPGRPPVRAVKGVSIEVHDGEFFVLVGPSGCGKSTTLRMVAGLEELTSGSIEIDGQVANDLPPRQRDVAMVFQDFALYPHMTVRGNMAFCLRNRGIPSTEMHDRVHRAAQMLGIERLLDRKPAALSGGERQRVALGRAVVRSPKAFLFDEPLSNLDTRLRARMRADLKRLHGELRATTLYVTHDQQEAMALGDRVAVMKDGAIAQCGAPMEVYERPANRFVAEFLGESPMNFLKGGVVRIDRTFVFDTGFGCVKVPESAVGVLESAIGRPLVYGIRPRDVSIQGIAADEPVRANQSVGPWPLAMTVTLVEPLGGEMDVHLSSPTGVQVVARAPAGAWVVEGTRVAVRFDDTRAHVFETGETGVNIVLNGYGANPGAN
jgi:multiple sugar transport system ATP-binding protein